MLLFICWKTSSMKIPPKANLQVLFMRKRIFYDNVASSINLASAHTAHLHPTAQKLVHASLICTCMETEVQ